MFEKIIGKEIENNFKAFYAGKLPRPCDEDCPKGCDGNHNYELPQKYHEFFKENLTKKALEILRV